MIKLTSGTVLLVAAVSLQALDHFQRLDYLKDHLPAFYLWLVSPTVEIGLLTLGVGFLVLNAWQMRRPQSPLAKPSVALPDRKVYHTIGFEYLPKSPLENDWAIAYPKPLPKDGEARFTTDPGMSGSLCIQAPPSLFCIEHKLPEHATLCEYIEFTAKYRRDKDNDPVVYAGNRCNVRGWSDT